MRVGMAFVQSVPSVRQFRSPLSNRVCICMKAKKSSKGPQKKPKEPARTIAPPTGFTVPENGVDRTSSSSPDPAVGIVPEQVSGAEGDATPHRAAVLNVQHLEDPRKALTSEPTVSEERVSLPAGKANMLRFEWSLSLDERVEKFEDARQLGTLEAVVEANRHLVTEALLYRFTSAILRVEGDKDRKEREEESRNMRELRRMLIAACWEIDTPLKKAVLRAEERLMTVLQSSDVRRYTDRNAGKSQIDVDAFWIVTYAAISAWEEMGRENAALVNINVQEALSIAGTTCRTTSRISDMLSPCLKFVEGVLSLSDPSAQADVLAAMEEEDIITLGAFVEQVRLLPTNAYDGLRRRMQTILDFVLSKRYGIEGVRISPVRFQPPEIMRGSKLASFDQTNTK